MSLSFIINSAFFIINMIRIVDASFNGHRLHLTIIYKIICNLGAVRIRTPIYYTPTTFLPSRPCESLEFVDEDYVD